MDPTDSTHLLLATDSGLLRSRNGGLDWTLEAASVLVGAVFAVALGGDGRHALVSTGTDLFRTTDGLAWRKTPAPAGAAPARALVAAGPERLYLAGWRGLHRSDDGGATWTDITAGIPQDPVSAVAPVAASPDHVYVVAGGRLWSSTDAGVTWRARDLGIPGARLETVALEPGDPARLWAGGTGGCTEATTEASPGKSGAGTLASRPSRSGPWPSPRRAPRWFSRRTAGSTASTRPGAGP